MLRDAALCAAEQTIKHRSVIPRLMDNSGCHMSESARLSPCVLIADDNQDAADSLALCLELEGFRVFVVYDGAAAVRASADHRPCVVILDIQMPRLNGYVAGKQIRYILGEDALLIALTALCDDQTKTRCRECRFDHHLSKCDSFDSVRHLVADRIAA